MNYNDEKGDLTCLSLFRSFHLSLNKSDALTGDDETLTQLGVVAGDLLFVLSPPQADLSNNANGRSNAASGASSSSSSCASEGGQTGDAAPVGSGMATCHDMDTDSSEPSDQQLPPSLPGTASGHSAASASYTVQSTSEGVQGYNMEGSVAGFLHIHF